MTPPDFVLEALFKAAFEAGGELLKQALSKAKQKWDTPRITATYTAKLLEVHGKTRILDRPDPVSLNDIFTDVYIWTKPQATERFTIEQLEAAHRAGEGRIRSNRYEGVSVVEQYKYLFILGKPGAGKTTFMKWITSLAVKGKLEGIPIFITLKEMADDGRDVKAQIVYLLSIWGIPQAEIFAEALLKSGKAIVLFDGLDEVPGEEDLQDKVIANIRDFVQEYSGNRYLITCRTAAVTHTFTDFTYVEVADFTPQQVEKYIKNYFAPDKKKAEQCLTELRQDKHEKLRELTASPLLLSLFCLNYAQSGAFPNERIDLYEEALLALLTRWNGTRSLRPKSVSPYGVMSPKRRTQLYSDIGYKNFTQGALFVKSALIASQIETFLETIPNLPDQSINGRNVLQDMEAQHGIIVERAKQVHAFAHLTFQEYYTAKYIADHEAKHTLDNLMLHTSDPRWREVFLLTASLLGNADAFFEKFLISLEEMAKDSISITEILKASMLRTLRYLHLTPIEGSVWGIQSALGITYGFDMIDVRAFILAIDLDNVFNLDRSRSRTLARTLNRTLDRTLSLEPYQPLDLTLASSEATTRLDMLFLVLGGASRTVDELSSFRDLTIETATVLKLPLLASALANLKLPKDDQSKTQWTRFRQTIAALALEHWGLRLNWKFTEREINQISDYLHATELLVQCLKLAVVTDREGIKNRLLMPPSA